MKFGKKIRHMLDIRGMSVADLIRQTGISKSLLNDLVNDKRTTTTTDTIEKIAKALNTPVGYFWEEDAVTPLEAISNLPNDLQGFVAEGQIDYLVLAKEFKDKELPTEVIRKLIQNYEELMNITKKE